LSFVAIELTFLENSSIKANIKLSCQYRVKQFSLIHGCINVRILLIELLIRYVCLLARFFYGKFPRISLIRNF